MAFCCSYAPNAQLLAFPSPTVPGGLAMLNLKNGKERLIKAHNHDVECIDMDYGGTVVASASKKGTIIRVFKVSDGKVLQEFRRGIDNAKIMSLAFDVAGMLLALSSDSGTVHLYSINNEEQQDDKSSNSDQKEQGGPSNKKSKLSFLSKAFKYFESEWSSLQMRVDEKLVFVNFNADSSEVLVYKANGKFWK